MGNRDLGSFLGFSLGLVVVLLLSFGLLQWLHIPSGQLLDWAIGIASFWWLLAIVTLPWNVYFEAKGTLTEAEASRRREIKVDELQIAYVQTVAQRALLIAIALHLLSAAGLYALAATGISAIGYISSVAALLLTGLRPAVSFYQYVARRLQDVRRTIKYPREDVVALKLKVTELETLAKQIQCHLNLDQRRDESWATQQETAITRLQTNFDQLTVAYKTLQTENQAEHHQLVKESRSAIAQLNEDSQFLEHAREIIRFFKSA